MLLEANSRIMVQGITGREASEMVEQMLAYDSCIVAGVTPGKAGQQVHGVPVFDTVAQAVESHHPDITIVSVPPPAVLDAALEAIVHGMKLCLIMTERVPIADSCRIQCAASAAGCTVIGPNSLGLIRPGVAKLGTIGGRIDNVKRSFMPGHVAILSRSGGMTTEIASFLTSHGIGQSIAIGIGGDRILGSTYVDLVPMLENDPSTNAIVIFGEPGGTAEEQLAAYLQKHGTKKPITAFLAGRFVDELEGVRFGHAAVMVEHGIGSVRSKTESLRHANVFVAEAFDDILQKVSP